MRYKSEAIALGTYASKCWAHVEYKVYEYALQQKLPVIEEVIATLPKAPVFQ